METNTDFNVLRNGPVTLGSEDFSYYMKNARTIYTHIGIDCPYDLHDYRMVVSDQGTLNVYKYWKHLLQWWIET